jgi:hypothetical protein
VPVTNSSDSYEIDLASIVPVIKPNKTSRSSKIYPKNGGKTLKKRGRGGGARITRSSR